MERERERVQLVITRYLNTSSTWKGILYHSTAICYWNYHPVSDHTIHPLCICIMTMHHPILLLAYALAYGGLLHACTYQVVMGLAQSRLKAPPFGSGHGTHRTDRTIFVVILLQEDKTNNFGNSGRYSNSR